LGSQARQIDFGGGQRLAVGIPWGDVSTAYYSTGIGNIEVFSGSNPKQLKQLRRANWLRPLLRQRWFQGMLKFGVAARIRPPTQEQREGSPTLVWGEVRNAAGTAVSARVRTANGYSFTVTSALAIVEEVMTHRYAPGFTTPALMMGAEFVTHLPGSSKIELQRT
jgi:short subunit dehydrogenase-like uncharacterized protein